MKTLRAVSVVPGQVTGEVLASSEPISFWGGYDWRTGEIIDRRHPLSGQIAAGKILAVPGSRGSSTTTAVLLEAIRAGTAPAAIVTLETDFFFALASVVAEEMFELRVPLFCVSPALFAELVTGDTVTIVGEAAGTELGAHVGGDA